MRLAPAIYQADGATVIGNGELAPITGGVVDVTAVALRETTPPKITVRAIGGMVPTSTLYQYQMTFEVTADETVQRIGGGVTYRLIHIASDDSRTVAAGIALRTGGTNNGN